MSVHGTPLDPGLERVTGASGEKPRLKLGRYEVVRELGKGAMGIVYLAKDPLIGRLVALKTIRSSAHADDDEEAKEFQQRFIREAQAAGILNHPAIVTVHDIGQDEASGMSFIAMEYVEGQNLKEVLAQGRTLTFDQIGEIIAQVAEAIDFAHAKGIVHRDVKPANIILVEGNRAKITDFGIAKIASGAANLTTTGQFLGTPNYMAPEQIRGAPVDGRTDIFSLGICLYECLTRRKPFGGDSLTSISYKIVHEPFQPLHEINPQIPAGYEEIVANCLAKDPAKRYQRGRDLANALRAVIRGEKPARATEPVFADETIVTRGRDKLPTIELPVPEAAVAAAPAPVSAGGGSTRPAAKAANARAVANRAPVAQRLRTTVTDLRNSPMWRRPVPPAIFIGVIAFTVALLIGAVAAIRSQQPEIPARDVALETRRAREKALREEGNALLRQGRVAEAYTRYEELQRLAPDSPFVASVMQKLNAIRQQEEISRQQLQIAQQKFDEGVTLFNEGKYDQAVERLQESFSINPNSDETAEYLKRAQQEQQKGGGARLGRNRGAPARQPVAVAGGGTQQAGTTQNPSATPAQLTTVFVHPFTDGRIVVRAGAEIVANEKLFDERPARFLRRASRSPRAVSVTEQFAPRNADVQVWVTVPAENIQEHHVLEAVRFESGTAHRLIVRYDRGSRRFTYEMN